MEYSNWFNEALNKAFRLMKGVNTPFVNAVMRYLLWFTDHQEWLLCDTTDGGVISRYDQIKSTDCLTDLVVQLICVGKGDELETEITFGEGWDEIGNECCYIGLKVGKTEELSGFTLFLSFPPESEQSNWVRRVIRHIENNRYRSFKFRPEEGILSDEVGV